MIGVIILLIIVIYLLTGLFFGLFFITRGIYQVDEAAEGTGWGFRLLILPGVIALWPVLLQKWLKSTSA